MILLFMINITPRMIFICLYDNHILCPFPAAQIRKPLKPEDWTAITVALQFYGCRNECSVLREFRNFWGGMEKCSDECEKKAAPAVTRVGRLQAPPFMRGARNYYLKIGVKIKTYC